MLLKYLLQSRAMSNETVIISILLFIVIILSAIMIITGYYSAPYYNNTHKYTSAPWGDRMAIGWFYSLTEYTFTLTSVFGNSSGKTLNANFKLFSPLGYI